jgi:hypothetical protein
MIPQHRRPRTMARGDGGPDDLLFLFFRAFLCLLCQSTLPPATRQAWVHEPATLPGSSTRGLSMSDAHFGRLRRLATVLQSRTARRAPELAKEAAVSVPTVYRDLKVPARVLHEF